MRVLCVVSRLIPHSRVDSSLTRDRPGPRQDRRGIWSRHVQTGDHLCRSEQSEIRVRLQSAIFSLTHQDCHFQLTPVCPSSLFSSRLVSPSHVFIFPLRLTLSSLAFRRPTSDCHTSSLDENIYSYRLLSFCSSTPPAHADLLLKTGRTFACRVRPLGTDIY